MVDSNSKRVYIGDIITIPSDNTIPELIKEYLKSEYFWGHKPSDNLGINADMVDGLHASDFIPKGEYRTIAENGFEIKERYNDNYFNLLMDAITELNLFGKKITKTNNTIASIDSSFVNYGASENLDTVVKRVDVALNEKVDKTTVLRYRDDIPVINPETGEQEVDPETNEPIFGEYVYEEKILSANDFSDEYRSKIDFITEESQTQPNFILTTKENYDTNTLKAVKDNPWNFFIYTDNMPPDYIPPAGTVKNSPIEFEVQDDEDTGEKFLMYKNRSANNWLKLISLQDFSMQKPTQADTLEILSKITPTQLASTSFASKTYTGTYVTNNSIQGAKFNSKVKDIEKNGNTLDFPEYPDLNTAVMDSININNNAITANKIADDSILTNKIINNAITANKIADNVITTNKIIDNAITTSKILNNNITTDKIADETIMNIDIAQNAAIDFNKLSNVAKKDHGHTLLELGALGSGATAVNSSAIGGRGTSIVPYIAENSLGNRSGRIALNRASDTTSYLRACWGRATAKSLSWIDIGFPFTFRNIPIVILSLSREDLGVDYWSWSYTIYEQNVAGFGVLCEIFKLNRAISSTSEGSETATLQFNWLAFGM